ncbi:MMPL family transporter [Paenibacillus sp. NEAU-GSW1]|uniref:MMPL family transporter n=1 Tax=Paenibacillus sp. NEAU-GSW1 TaxID=2682486 RepID=UPI0012E3200C|nr:MMPL family transporter [Paenibacillus sp. NEAU-GSW1]MUT68348.1 MMPL family transporter [Paenibacillus sp. NEAU-GSW1]
MRSKWWKWSQALYKARWAIVIMWLILVIAGGSNFGKLPSVLSGGGWEVPDSQSQNASQLLASEFEGRSDSSLTLILRDPNHAAGSKLYNDKLSQLVDRLKTEDGVKSVFSLLDTSPALHAGLVGSDPNTSIAFIDMNIETDYLINRMPAYQNRLAEQAESLGVEAYMLGMPAFQGETSAQSQKGLARAEAIVLPLIIVILLFVYRSAAATATSLIVTIASLLVAMGIIYWTASAGVQLSVFVTNAAMMLGLGVGIDYTLFMVSRFKLEMATRGDILDALSRTMETAGHTVVYSAVTVIVSLAALLIVPLTAVRSIAFGGITVVFVAGLASMSLLPAVLSLWGQRINSRKQREQKSTNITAGNKWRSWTSAIMRKPALIIVITLGVLASLALPAFNMKLYAPDFRVLPAHTDVRQGFQLLEDSFGKGATSPVSIVLRNDNSDLRSPEAFAAIAALHAGLSHEDHVESVSSPAALFSGMAPANASKLLMSDSSALPVDIRTMAARYISKDGHTAAFELKLLDYGSSDTSREIVERLRDIVLPSFPLPEGTSFHIGGETMAGMETAKAVTDSLLPVLAIMLILIFIILVATFRSILLPLKAILFNLFSVSATYGVLVLVFANGYGSEVFNVESNGYIIHFVPILLLALLFGLSTDYEVFLVSRMKEEYAKSRDTMQSITVGIEKTGPMISVAAVLMFAVFSGFALSGVLPIQMLGFGMAVAIVLDATIIRLLLVPAAMKLLGKGNWWFPGKRKSPSNADEQSNSVIQHDYYS